MLVCRRLRALADLPAAWRCLTFTGPSRWLSFSECAAMQRRGTQIAAFGGAAAPHACINALLAVAPTLQRVSLDLPPAMQDWASATYDFIDAITERCPGVLSLCLTRFERFEVTWEEQALGADLEWPERAVESLVALLCAQRLRTLLLLEVGIPPEVMPVLGEAAGESLHALGFYHDCLDQLAAAPGMAAHLTGLRLLGTAWQTAPRLLPCFWAASAGLGRLRLTWRRDYLMPDFARRAAEYAARLEAALDAPQPAPIALQEDAAEEPPAAGEIDACLLALARVAARCAAAAAAAAEEGAPLALRPLAVEWEGPDAPSAEGIAAAQRIYAPLTAAPLADCDADDSFWC
jgi:hypothetical protein